MRTPAEWTKNLKNNHITEEMLDAALFSVNKRAKNCRDKAREYKYDFEYHNDEKYKEKEARYYRQKEEMLSHVHPVCIHKEYLKYERIRHYDYEKKFADNLARCLCGGLICWSNSFVNRRKNHGDSWYDDFDDDFYEPYQEPKRTYFFDELLPDRPVINYYLYYMVGTHSYHSPIGEKDIPQYISDAEENYKRGI